MFSHLKTATQIPFLLLFLSITLISCDEDEGIPMDEMTVSIFNPSFYLEIVDSVEFIGLLQADALDDLSSFQASWISDKDGVLFTHTLDKSGNSKCKVKLSRNIHEITFEVSNGHGEAKRQTITLYNVIHLFVQNTAYGKKLQWDASVDITDYRLYRSENSSQLKENLPILNVAASAPNSFLDTTATIDNMTFYLLEGDVDGHTIRSNIAVGKPASALQLDYPLMKLVADGSRNFVYGIVSPDSRYDENKTGYGIVFINTVSQKVEKRILETVRFNDLDINPQGDRLYLSERNRKIYVVDLNTQALIETISLENFIRKLEVGSNDRLYFHVELAANNNYEFRIVDLVTKKELPFKFSGEAGGSFDAGDMELDPINNTIYFSGPARIKTTFDIFSDAIGTSCCSNPGRVIFRNRKVFVQEQLYNQDLVMLGSFSGKYGNEHIFDCNANATLAVGWYSIFNVADRGVRKRLPFKYAYSQAVFLDDSRLLFVQTSNSIYQVYRSDLYFYQFPH